MMPIPFPASGLVIKDFVVHYADNADTVDILYIRHGRQNDPWVEIEDDQDFEL